MDKLDPAPAESTAYPQIKEYVENHFGFKVSSLAIAQTKRNRKLIDFFERYCKVVFERYMEM